MPPTLDALLGEGHPRVIKFLAACQDLDFDEWRSIHGVLHTARDKMAARKKTRSRMLAVLDSVPGVQPCGGGV